MVDRTRQRHADADHVGRAEAGLVEQVLDELGGGVQRALGVVVDVLGPHRLGEHRAREVRDRGVDAVVAEVDADHRAGGAVEREQRRRAPGGHAGRGVGIGVLDDQPVLEAEHVKEGVLVCDLPVCLGEDVRGVLECAHDFQVILAREAAHVFPQPCHAVGHLWAVLRVLRWVDVLGREFRVAVGDALEHGQNFLDVARCHRFFSQRERDHPRKTRGREIPFSLAPYNQE